jgi:REP element-mobilizing transposase RayT
MAKYDHLTIFQKSYDLMIRVYKEVHNFSREYKYSLGQKIKDICLELLDWIIIANSEKDKKRSLLKVNQQVDRLKIYIRLCNSLNIISKKKYEVLSKYIDEIGRMTGGWLKSSSGTGQNFET